MEQGERRELDVPEVVRAAAPGKPGANPLPRIDLDRSQVVHPGPSDLDRDLTFRLTPRPLELPCHVGTMPTKLVASRTLDANAERRRQLIRGRDHTKRLAGGIIGIGHQGSPSKCGEPRRALPRAGRPSGVTDAMTDQTRLPARLDVNQCRS